MSHCSACGAPLGESVRFCSQCGARVEVPAANPETRETAAGGPRRCVTPGGEPRAAAQPSG